MGSEREVRALIDGAVDALQRLVTDVREKAETNERVRDAEHRAFMAEQREAAALMLRTIEAKLSEVRDGAPGRDGVDGKDGADGAPGERGPQGEAGRDGVDGAPGADGRDGVDGAPGADGRDGIDGKDGADGAAGADGAPGRDGVDGKDGEIGPQGDAGRDGIDGKDAYAGEARGLFDPEASYRAMDVVSLNGSEWRAKRDDPGGCPGDGWMLSASRGKRGDRGERGLQGRDGAPGKDGAVIIASFIDTKAMELTQTLSDGTEIKTDLYAFGEEIRAAAARDAGRS